MIICVILRAIGILLLTIGSAYLLLSITAACLGKYGDSKEAALSSVVIGVFLTIVMVLVSTWLPGTPVKNLVSKQQIMLQVDVSQSMDDRKF